MSSELKGRDFQAFLKVALYLLGRIYIFISVSLTTTLLLMYFMWDINVEYKLNAYSWDEIKTILGI